jgi:hypothetical protein
LSFCGTPVNTRHCASRRAEAIYHSESGCRYEWIASPYGKLPQARKDEGRPHYLCHPRLNHEAAKTPPPAMLAANFYP